MATDARACLCAFATPRATEECRSLYANSLNGTIPTEMGSLTSLSYLCMSALAPSLLAPQAPARASAHPAALG